MARNYRPTVTEVIGSNPRASGFAIIISNDYGTTPGLDTLEGTHKDSERMEGALKSRNITTYKTSNVTKFQLVAFLNEVAQCTEYPRESRCIAFVFSGHGLDSNQVYMQDGKLVHIANEIIQPLLPIRAPHISKIPKLFFIDACRGSRDITPVVIPRSAGGAVQEIHQKGGTDATLKVPPEGNFLVAFSTMPEYRSYEMKGEGGVWMTALAEKLRTSQDSVEGILTEVRKELLEKYQTPGWTARMQQSETFSRLNEKVYLAQDIKSVGRQVASTTGTTTGLGFLTHPPATQKSPQHPGHFRGLLNQMWQLKDITRLDYKEDSVVDEGNVVGFTGVVTFTHQGIPKRFTSHGVHTTKDSAKESAAEQAFSAIGARIDRGGSSTSQTSPLKPSQTKIPANATVPKPAVSPPNKTPVSKLKELCEQKKWPQPDYKPITQLGEQRFQFQVVVKTPARSVTALGSVCGSKTEAKHSAAQALIIILRL